ncbi:hypothetical protein [Halonotius pteroides]|nr:hypothetical protein [Halonotius pteroides]
MEPSSVLEGKKVQLSMVAATSHASGGNQQTGHVMRTHTRMQK